MLCITVFKGFGPLTETPNMKPLFNGTQQSQTFITSMQSKNHKRTVHNSVLQSNPGSNPLQGMIHNPDDGLLKRMHRHITTHS